jgi:SAM-dependent methyltransferase
MKLDRAIRRFIPSAARLTYNPLFKAVVNLFDLAPRLMFREVRGIPPNHMRIRVGVGNRIATNQISYITGAENFWIYAIQSGLCRLDYTIVDLGCGCGRYAHHLRDYRYKSDTFTGTYIGIDIDDEMLEWCRRHFDPTRFVFHRSTHCSKTYNNVNGVPDRYYTLPQEDESTDFLFSTSLLTHLLEHQLVNYFEEGYRVLRPARYMAMHCFCMDFLPPTYGDRHTFRHSVGNAYVESLTVPEAAVAYTQEFLFNAARKAGFGSVDLVTGLEDGQPMLLCQK